MVPVSQSVRLSSVRYHTWDNKSGFMTAPCGCLRTSNHLKWQAIRILGVYYSGFGWSALGPFLFYGLLLEALDQTNEAAKEGFRAVIGVEAMFNGALALVIPPPGLVGVGYSVMHWFRILDCGTRERV